MFDTLTVFLKELFEKLNFEKKLADDNINIKNYQHAKDKDLTIDPDKEIY